MPAAPPERFGPYEVVAPLGAGGMGEVYRARDTRLNRQVAIKILARTGADPIRQERLLDEAQAASALNHPNIIVVHDVGIHEGAAFIVSELVEGASLRELMARTAMPIRDALDLAAQMADGLAVAHQAGIVHRDFKPENVMVTRDGRVKILDFGLAVVGTRGGLPPGGSDPTLTVTGTIAGTVAYMSPEQARAAAVDYRSDQFSFGLTIYEMVTGRRAFAGDTPAQVLTAIIEDDAEPIAKINPRVPAPLRWLIERCLAKDPRQRYDSTTDLARELRTLRDRLPEFTTATGTAPARPRRRGRLFVAGGALALAAVAGVLAAAMIFAGRSDLERYRYTPIATDGGYQASPVWSPDGKTLAYVAAVNGVLQLFTKALGSPTRTAVTHSRWDCRDPFWSPDGTRLYYISLARDREGLWAISSAGGEPEIIKEDVYRAALAPDGRTLAFFRGYGGTFKKLYLAVAPEWRETVYERAPFGTPRGYVEVTLHFSPDSSRLGAWVEQPEGDRILQSEFWVIPLDSATPYQSRAPVENLAGIAPMFAWLPDSRHVISALPRPGPGTHLWLMDTQRGTGRLLTATPGSESDPAVDSRGDRLAFTVQDANYDLLDFSSEHAVPAPALVTSRNEMDPAWSPLRKQLAFATDRSGRIELWVRSQNGEERPVVTPEDFGAEATSLLSAPALSPDGERIAFNRGGREGLRIWIKPVAGGPPVQLTSDAGTQDSPSWSPDGTWIAYSQALNGAWWLARARLGGGTPERVFAEIIPFSPVQWAPDGAWIAFNSRSGLTIVSPDAKASRVLHEGDWMAFAWSEDSRQLFGIRLSDDQQHLTFASIDVRTAVEHVHGANFMSLPVYARLVRGMTRTSATTYTAAIVHVQSDIWLLENFLPPATWRERLASAFAVRRP